ncbi:MAG TPA: hypothetical protein VNA25_19910 [Phycisphaerae bacterium]|nr:hypothetical protein [Phycisphaerae bacterium]
MPPGFSEEQKALIEQVAWKVSEKLEERIAAHLAALDGRMVERIDAHAKGCSIGKKVGIVATMFGLAGAGLGLLFSWLGGKFGGGP